MKFVECIILTEHDTYVLNSIYKHQILSCLPDTFSYVVVEDNPHLV